MAPKAAPRSLKKRPWAPKCMNLSGLWGSSLRPGVRHLDLDVPWTIWAPCWYHSGSILAPVVLHVGPILVPRWLIAAVFLNDLQFEKPSRQMWVCEFHIPNWFSFLFFSSLRVAESRGLEKWGRRTREGIPISHY